MDEPIRDLLGAVAEGKEGRRIPKKAQEVLRAIEDGERVVARGATDAELLSIAEALLAAVEDENDALVQHIGIVVSASPGVAGRLLKLVGAMAILYGDAVGATWRDDLRRQWAQAAINEVFE